MGRRLGRYATREDLEHEPDDKRAMEGSDHALPSKANGLAHAFVQREDGHDTRKGIDDALAPQFVPEFW